jgi:hypothetical protein
MGERSGQKREKEKAGKKGVDVFPYTLSIDTTSVVPFSRCSSLFLKFSSYTFQF